jgi:hypothetical protein
MTRSKSARRSALAVASMLFGVVLLASVPIVWADDITYNIVDYPESQGGYTVTGSITTDGTLGEYDGPDQPGVMPHVLSVSLAIRSPSASYISNSTSWAVCSLDPALPPIFYATPTQLLVPSGYACTLLASIPPTDNLSNAQIALEYDPRPDYVAAFGPGYGASLTGETTSGARYSRTLFDQCDLAGSGTTIDSSDPWIIATAEPVPEPSVAIGLCTSLVGLGAIYLRQRGAKA